MAYRRIIFQIDKLHFGIKVHNFLYVTVIH